MEIEESNYQDTVVFDDVVISCPFTNTYFMKSMTTWTDNTEINAAFITEIEEQSIQLVIVEIEPTIEPAIEPVIEPVIEPAIEPVIEPAIEPVVEPVVEPVIEPVVEQPVIKPVIEQPVIEQPAIEPVIEPSPAALDIYLIDNDEIQLQIPKRIYICHKNINCLTMTHNKWKKLNPNYEIYLFDDFMSEQFLLNEYSQLHYNVFKFIPDGPIKSDFWRLCILYKYGGIYVDADIHPLIPIDNYLIPTSDFVTCITKANRNFNPHFIAVKKKEHILQLCINEYIEMYTNKRHLYDYWKWSIVHIINKYLNTLRNPKISTVVFKNKKFQFFIETTNYYLRSPSLHDYYCVFNNVRLFNSRYINYHPYEHQFKNEICVSHNNDNNKYSIIGFEMKNSLMLTSSSRNNRSVSGRSVSGRSVSGRSVSGRSVSGRSVSGRSISGRSISGRSISGRNISGRSISGRSISGRSISGRSISGKNRSNRNNRNKTPKKQFVILFNNSKII